MKDYVKKTIEVYDRLGSKYTSSIEKAVIDETEMFMEKLPNGSKILDVGCSGGRDSKLFTDAGFEVIGIDLCEDFLTLARKNVSAAIFLKKDLLELDFEDESFDSIWASAVLLHLEKEDITKVLHDFYRILKKDGIVFIAVKKGAGEKFVTDSLSGGNSRYFSFYTKDEIENFIQKAGFKIIYSKIRGDETGRNEVQWIRIFAQKI